MKVLLAVHRYPPYIGGSEEVSRRIAEHLARCGHDVTVATGAHKARVPGTAGPCVESFKLRSSSLWPNLPRSEAHEARRYRELFSGDWDVRFIYAAQSWALNVVWDLVGTGNAADILAPVGYSWLGKAHASAYFEVMTDLLPRFSAVVYHSTEYQDHHFARDRGLLSNAVVIPNGTATVPEEAVRGKHDHDTCLLLTVGSHVRSKGHADFLRVARSLVAPRPATLRERLRGCYFYCRAMSASNPRVEHVEGSAPARVAESYRRAGVFFLPSTVETAPLVILEAMASATPWVSYDVGSVKTLPGGIVVPDVDEAARALRGLVNDPARRRALAREGRAAIETTYSWDKVLPRYRQVVETAGAR
jgi:glycosyltransferase involved in cell wall biosynthesis